MLAAVLAATRCCQLRGRELSPGVFRVTGGNTNHYTTADPEWLFAVKSKLHENHWGTRAARLAGMLPACRAVRSEAKLAHPCAEYQMTPTWPRLRGQLAER